MSYSNSGYVVLGAIIEKASGPSYERFVTEHLFKPAGMTDSGYDSNTALIPRRRWRNTSAPTNWRQAP
jgi:CubicO group peptidase (beta-lactamase class C family)